MFSAPSWQISVPVQVYLDAFSNPSPTRLAHLYLSYHCSHQVALSLSTLLALSVLVRSVFFPPLPFRESCSPVISSD